MQTHLRSIRTVTKGTTDAQRTGSQSIQNRSGRIEQAKTGQYRAQDLHFRNSRSDDASDKLCDGAQDESSGGDRTNCAQRQADIWVEDGLEGKKQCVSEIEEEGNDRPDLHL
jgi:hypothetical protein